MTHVGLAGRCILVTIHQPSIEIFEAFDAMVLLQAGGRVSPLRLPGAHPLTPPKFLLAYVWSHSSKQSDSVITNLSKPSNRNLLPTIHIISL